MNNKVISCHSSSLLIAYAKEKLVPDQQLFAGIEQHAQMLANKYEWTDCETWSRLAKNVQAFFPADSHALYDAGYAVAKTKTPSYQILFLQIVPLSILVKRISEQFRKNIHKGLVVTSQLNLKEGMVDIQYEPINKSVYSAEICEFNKGGTIATLEIKGFKSLSLIEHACATRDDVKACHLHITWKIRPSIFERIKDFLFFRFRDQRSIIAHIEESHTKLQSQYHEILTTRDFYSHIMTNMNEGILWLNKSGVVTFVNKGFLSIANLTESEVINRHYTGFILRPELQAQCQALLADCLKVPNVAKSIELTIVPRNTTERIVQATFIWVHSDHQPGGYLVNIADITERKKIEQRNSELVQNLQELNTTLEDKVADQTADIREKAARLETAHDKLVQTERFKDLLASTVVHDIKNNIFSISADTKVLGRSVPNTPQTQKFITRMQSSCFSAMSLAINMLDIAKMEEGKLTLNKELIDHNALTALVNKNSQQVFFDEKHITVTLLPIGHDFVLSADRYLLDRMIQNLLTNAAMYTPENGTVRISTGPGATITIYNSGEPIPEKYHDTIFDKYSRVASESSNYSKGLGLFFCKLVMEAHGGMIGLTADEKGNCFGLGF